MPSRPRPGDPWSPARRRLLVALGFGAVDLLVLRGLPSAGSGKSPVANRPTAVAGAPPPPPSNHVFDLVIAGGRVIDPDTGFDAEADVGIDGKTIGAISRRPLRGRRQIDASDRVVSPGFIDNLSYDPNPYGIWFKVADGVTTNMCMHGINSLAPGWFAHWSQVGSPCHFGGAFDDPWARAQLGLEPDDAASPAEVEHLARMADQAISHGYVGIDFEPEYTPGVGSAEIDALARVAARRGVPCYFHGRYSDVQPPGTNADTLAEILRTARETGAAVHVDHIVSTGGTFSMDESLATLQRARDHGVDVTACMYPYDFWATFLGSARFADGWEQRFRIGYGDLQIAGTRERLNATTFPKFRKENRLAVAYAIPDDDVRAALVPDFVMLGSDGILEQGDHNHPRGAGTFARTLGRYVREKKVVDLRDALAKMTIMPARRLERRAPAMRRKGRLQRGADADITIFDPDRVTDRATVARPAVSSVGIDWVLVLGTVVKDPDGVRRGVHPGRPITYGL